MKLQNAIDRLSDLIEQLGDKDDRSALNKLENTIDKMDKKRIMQELELATLRTEKMSKAVAEKLKATIRKGELFPLGCLDEADDDSYYYKVNMGDVFAIIDSLTEGYQKGDNQW